MAPQGMMTEPSTGAAESESVGSTQRAWSGLQRVRATEGEGHGG